MKIIIKKLDPVGVEEEIVNFSNTEVLIYYRILVEVDGIKYMLTKDCAYII
jgi:hypothetical protein